MRIAPIDAQLESYTYNPVRGITSAMGPNGNRVTYEYDEVGRLSLVRDHDGNILEKNSYHYKQ